MGREFKNCSQATQQYVEKQKMTMQNPFVSDLVHSEDEVLHGLQHLICAGNEENGGQRLEGHETMMIYRNVRKKYSTTPRSIKEGLHCIETFRTPEKGLEAAYRAAMCRDGPIREASALYVTINPRNVSQAMTLTQTGCNKWMEFKAGLNKEHVKGMDREDYIGTLDRELRSNILKCRSRRRFDMIDVDDPDPTTWLRRIREAIGDEHIELITETKNGYHVVYNGKGMKPDEHRKLQGVLEQNPGKGPLEKVTRGKGSSVACALPGGSQSYHKTKIIYCSCERSKENHVETS